MNTNRMKFKTIGIISLSIGLIVLLYVVYQFKLGIMTKNRGLYLAAVGFIPALSFVVFYSLKTGETFAKGQRIAKGESPKLYYVALSFWCALFLIDLVYVLYRITAG